MQSITLNLVQSQLIISMTQHQSINFSQSIYLSQNTTQTTDIGRAPRKDTASADKNNVNKNNK